MIAQGQLAVPRGTTTPSNRILAPLPSDVRLRLQAHLQPTVLRLGEVLYSPNSVIPYAYFPLTAVVSLHYVLDSGSMSESAAVGREGMVGVALIMGGDTTPSWAAVQIAGSAMRLEARVLKQEFRHSAAMQSRLLRYTLSLMNQVTQTAVCNRHHSVEQQLCRWLLVTQDRAARGELVVTQEQIAGALGVRRESVTEAAGRLQVAGAISYRRGHITVLSRPGLLSFACECYEAVRLESDRLSSPDLVA